ncbi:MAG: hypothetical protein HY556_04810 [Euryarchaeota archaeon]|nr:hypothetical protein [Euryarchaeota archaeon]
MKREALPRDMARVYLDRAEEFGRAMDTAAERGDWSAAGLGAIHCVISGLDAITTTYVGARSRGPDHLDVLDLLKEANLQDAATPMRQARRVLEMKNVVEYEARRLSEAEGRTLRRDATRVLHWCRLVMAVRRDSRGPAG